MAFLLTTVGSADLAGAQDVLGTVEATLDGEERTWYAVSGDSRTGFYSSAIWMEIGDNRVVTISGFDTDTPPVHDFSTTPDDMSLGDYEGSSLIISVVIPSDGEARTFSLPIDDGGGAVDVVYTPRAPDLLTGVDPSRLYSLVEGTVEVEAGEVAGENASGRGSFSGVLESAEGRNRIAVTDGRFEVREVPAAERVTGGRE